MGVEHENIFVHNELKISDVVPDLFQCTEIPANSIDRQKSLAKVCNSNTYYSHI